MTKKRTSERKRGASKAPRGSKASVKSKQWILSSGLLQHFGLSEKESRAVAEFRTKTGEERLKAARRAIQDQVIDAIEPPDVRFGLAVAESESLLKGYATLDSLHRSEIQRLVSHISGYLRDETRKRPFNALMLASPGAGKSHFIKQLAFSMKSDRVQAVTFNMATMQSADDMAQPIDELRNLKVNDRFPLLFLDEFDSDPSRYAALLPLLWDGELHIGHRDLKLGKAVIVLAGSNPDLPKAMSASATMRVENVSQEYVPSGKLVDLLSRINGGVLEIPDLDLRSQDRDRRVDKVCVTVGLLKGRFGHEISAVPRSLLRFIAHSAFRYGVRSIAHLVDLIDAKSVDQNKLSMSGLGLPIGSAEALQASSLRLHLFDRDQAFGIASRWSEFSKDKEMVSLKQSPLLSSLPFQDRLLFSSGA